jgi:tetratricopeptide (TPR) repeat protein
VISRILFFPNNFFLYTASRLEFCARRSLLKSGHLAENLVVQVPIFGRSKDTEYEQAARLLANNDTHAAIDRFREIISKKPDHINARVSLAVALMHTQDEPNIDSPLTIEALEQLDTAASLAPDDPVPYFNKGVLLRDLKQFDKAIRCFELALDIEERLAPAILHMAEINYELGNWDKAIELARLALIRDPGMEGSMGWVRVAMRKAGLLDDDGNVIDKQSDDKRWPMRKAESLDDDGNVID